MKYYKLSMDMERKNDIICHYEKIHNIPQNTFQVGRMYYGWDNKFNFYYDKQEGSIPTDYLANDKGWFVVSNKLKNLLENMNTEIQYLPIRITEKSSDEELIGYYIANIVRVVDALCLEKSKYFTTEIADIGTIYTVSKFGIYADKTEDSDIFKLANRQEIPIFVSENFMKAINSNSITGMSLREISVV